MTIEEQEYEHATALRMDDYAVTPGWYLMNRLEYVTHLLTDGDEDDPDRGKASNARAALIRELRRRLAIADRAEGRTPPEG